MNRSDLVVMVFYSLQSAAMMGREIMALKAQVSELTNMMKLSFDLQLDIQRSIRQEVAAAINQALGKIVKN